MMISKLGSVIIFSTDNLLLSSFLGLIVVGQYSNYIIILSGITSILGQGIGAVTSSIDNLNVTENEDKQTAIFYKCSYLSSVITIICSVELITYFSPFITVWLGSKFVFSPTLTLLMVVGFLHYKITTS